MRLDHLLSKENRVFVLLLGWVLVSTWLVTVFVIAWCCLVLGGGKFLFSGESKYRTWLYARVGGSVKQG